MADPLTPQDVARWRLHSQRLAGPRAADPAAVVDNLLAVQAENPGQAAWAVGTRCVEPRAAAVAQALAGGTVLRTHLLRPTWHWVRREDVGWLVDTTRPRVLPVLERQLRQHGVDPAGYARLEARVADAVAAGRHLTRPELAERLADAELPGQALMIVMACAELNRAVVGGAPRHGEHTYASFDERAAGTRVLDPDEARAELVRRYVSGHGPVTERDLAYWATQPLGFVRAGLADNVDVLGSFELDGETYWHLGDPPPAGAVEPIGHLLQLLDEYYRGYQHTRGLLDLAGLLPAGREQAVGMLVVDAQMVAWMKRTVGPRQLAFDLTPLRELGPREVAAAEAAAARYAAFLDREPQLRIR